MVILLRILAWDLQYLDPRTKRLYLIKLKYLFDVTFLFLHAWLKELTVIYKSINITNFQFQWQCKSVTSKIWLLCYDCWLCCVKWSRGWRQQQQQRPILCPASAVEPASHQQQHGGQGGLSLQPPLRPPGDSRSHVRAWNECPSEGL